MLSEIILHELLPNAIIFNQILLQLREDWQITFFIAFADNPYGCFPNIAFIM